jgi:ribosomal protein L7/L12
MNPRPLPPEVVATLEAGHRIDAIRKLQLATGMSLKEAKDSIEAYERAGPAAASLDRSAGIKLKGSHPIPVEAVNALRDGRVIEAVRIVRTSGNYGLAEAKGLIDQLQREMPQAKRARTAGSRRGLSPGEVARDGGAGKWLVLLLVAAIVIAFILYR